MLRTKAARNFKQKGMVALRSFEKILPSGSRDAQDKSCSNFSQIIMVAFRGFEKHILPSGIQIEMFPG